jgi:hypothetical protein
MVLKEGVMLELTEAQRQALAGETCLRLRDPETNATYVLVKEDVFERMRQIVDGFTRSAGWDDPELDVYEQFRDQP